MVKEKACRECRKITVEGAKCANCNSSQFTTFWRGFVVIINPDKSELAKKMGITNPGKYALRLSR